MTCYSCSILLGSASQNQSQLLQKTEQAGKADKGTHYMIDDPSSDPGCDHELFTISESHTNSFQLDVTLNGVPLRMDLDMGASVSVLNKVTYKSIQQQSYMAPLIETTNKSRSYTDHFIQVLGITEVKARYGGNKLVLLINEMDLTSSVNTGYLSFISTSMRSIWWSQQPTGVASRKHLFQEMCKNYTSS